MCISLRHSASPRPAMQKNQRRGASPGHSQSATARSTRSRSSARHPVSHAQPSTGGFKEETAFWKPWTQIESSVPPRRENPFSLYHEYTALGETKPLKEWLAQTHVAMRTFRKRIEAGQTVEQALRPHKADARKAEKIRTRQLCDEFGLDYDWITTVRRNKLAILLTYYGGEENDNMVHIGPATAVCKVCEHPTFAVGKFLYPIGIIVSGINHTGSGGRTRITCANKLHRRTSWGGRLLLSITPRSCSGCRDRVAGACRTRIVKSICTNCRSSCCA